MAVDTGDDDVPIITGTEYAGAGIMTLDMSDPDLDREEMALKLIKKMQEAKFFEASVAASSLAYAKTMDLHFEGNRILGVTFWYDPARYNAMREEQIVTDVLMDTTRTEH
jgi:hypothetical protein